MVYDTIALEELLPFYESIILMDTVRNTEKQYHWKRTINSESAKIWPNPAKNKLYVRSTDDINRLIVENNLGQILVDDIVKNKEYQLKCDGFPPSIYFVKIYHSDNQFQTFKIVIE